MGHSGTHNYGNYFRRSESGGAIELDGDTVIMGGNYTLCRVTTNGYNLDIQGGNVRGLYIDGVKQDSYVWQRFEAYPLAADIVEGIMAKSANEGLAMWSETVDRIFAEPVIGYPDLVADIDAWAKTDPGDGEGVTNTLDIDSSFKRLQSKFFPGQTYNQIKTELLSKPRETWDGVETELVEEYS